MLLLVAPCGVSPIEPDTVTPSNGCCSAPIFRSHLSSLVESLSPVVTLVPTPVMLSLADCSVSWFRVGRARTPGRPVTASFAGRPQ